MCISVISPLKTLLRFSASSVEALCSPLSILDKFPVSVRSAPIDASWSATSTNVHPRLKRAFLSGVMDKTYVVIMLGFCDWRMANTRFFCDVSFVKGQYVAGKSALWT
jgi:hypothetical protein